MMTPWENIIEKALALGPGANYSGSTHRQMMIELIGNIEELQESLGQYALSENLIMNAILLIARDGEGNYYLQETHNNTGLKFTITAEDSAKFWVEPVEAETGAQLVAQSIACNSDCLCTSYGRGEVLDKVLFTTVNYGGSGYTGAFGDSENIMKDNLSITIQRIP